METEEMNKSEPNGVAYWRGKVDQNLMRLEKKVQGLEDKIDILAGKIDKITIRLGHPGHEQFISWESIRRKIFIPLLLAFLTFLFFTILPGILVLIYLLPDILASIN